MKKLEFLKLIGGKFAGSFSFLTRHRKVRRITAAVVFLILTTFITSVEFIPQKVDLEVGQVSPSDVAAPRTIVFEDKTKTIELQKEAEEAVVRQYDMQPQVNAAVQKDITDLMDDIANIAIMEGVSNSEKRKQFQERVPFSLPDSTVDSLVQASPRDYDHVKRSVNSLINESMQNGIKEDELNQTKKKINSGIADMGFSSQYEQLAQGSVNFFLRPNMFLNMEKTAQMKAEARESVLPVQVTIKQNEKIIGKGEIVTEEHLIKLRALGLTRSQLPISNMVGSLLLIILLSSVVLLYLYQQNREIYQAAGHLYLMGLVVIFILLIGKAIISINFTQWPQFGALFGYMVPLAAGGMIIAILLDSRLAVFVVALMSLLLGIMTGHQLKFAIVGFIGGIAGVYSVSKLSQRGDLARSGIYTSAANIVAIFTMGLVTGTPLALVVASSLIMGIINGLLSSVLTNGFLPYLENVFRITSPVRLLELSNPGNPLLKQLLTEAPGTYHHSIIVGNLAEAAADAVGAEPLLVRVGAYYHDIGKIKRPYLFIENQLYAENPHDKLAPSLSTLILTSHVKDGVEMAKEHKLPQGVIDIIEQHHGTGLVTFFYHKALENEKNENIDEEDYRYDGPKPQSKEAAIVMVADGVEAAVRSLQNPTPGRIEGLVRKIIKEKLMDGQFDESDLTFKDLDLIANSFVKILTGIFHTRIEYPDIAKEMERRKKKRGDIHK